MKRLRSALCCECGTTRTVSARYNRRVEDLNTNGQDLAPLRCETCGITTRHALVMDSVVEVPSPIYPSWSAPVQQSVHRPEAPRYEPPETIEELMADYGKWMRSWGASENTVKQRCILAEQTIMLFIDPPYSGHAVPTVDDVREFLARPGLSDWTRSTYFSHLKNWCEWLLEMQLLDSNPMDELRAPRRPRSKPRPISEEEVARVLAAAEGRTRDWIQLALLAGLRVHEIAKIRGEDIAEDGLFVNGKGGKQVTLPVHPELWAIAQRYPRTGYWFPSSRGGHITAPRVTGAVTALFREVGIESGSIHRCRHVYGTRLLRAGVNIRVVQELMRHSSIQTTAAYTAVDEREMAAAIRLLPGQS